MKMKNENNSENVNVNIYFKLKKKSVINMIIFQYFQTKNEFQNNFKKLLNITIIIISNPSILFATYWNLSEKSGDFLIIIIIIIIPELTLMVSRFLFLPLTTDPLTLTYVLKQCACLYLPCSDRLSYLATYLPTYLLNLLFYKLGYQYETPC